MKESTANAVAEKNIVLFKLNNQIFGIDICHVRRIMEHSEISSFPNAPDFIEGVLKIGKHIILIIDLIKKLKLKSDKKDSVNSKILVCKLNNFVIGLSVDSVIGVSLVKLDAIEKVPDFINQHIDNINVEGTSVIDNDLVILLNLENIINRSEITYYANQHSI